MIPQQTQDINPAVLTKFNSQLKTFAAAELRLRYASNVGNEVAPTA